MADQMRLYTMPGSPYGRRVELVLAEKNIPHETIPLSRSDGDLRTPEHLQRSPHGRVPALVDGDTTLYESQVIVEYLEERTPSPALVPGDAAGRAQVRIEEAECQTYFLPELRPVAIQMFMTAPEDRDMTVVEKALETLHGALGRLEQRAAGRGGDNVLGSALTRADLGWLTAMEICERGGLVVDPAQYPWLDAWRSRLSQRPSYDATYPAHWR